VTAGIGRRGEWAFKLVGRELGHLHGDHAAHFFSAEDEWGRLYDAGRIGFHPVFPQRRGPAAGDRGAAGRRGRDPMTRLNYECFDPRRQARAA